MKRLLFLIVILAGCTAIPTAGPVNAGLDIGSTAGSQTEQPVATGPRPGMNQVEVVQGFLAANSSAVGDYSIARSYLADFVAGEWLPSLGIQVYETALNLQQSDENTVTAIGVSKLALDENLRPILNLNSEVQSISFFLIQDDGEWRISNPPNGLILLSTEFQRNYEISTLWFVDKQLDRLVPDFIAVSQRIDAATQLIRALSNGSGNWLKPAVTNLLATESSGGLASIQRDGEKIVVDFEADILRLTPREQAFLVSQIAQTLYDVPGVTQLEVTVGGQLLSGTNITNPLSLQSDSWIGQRITKSSNIYAISRSNNLVQPISRLQVSSWLNQYPDAYNLTVASDEQRIAIWSRNSAEVVVGYRTQNPRSLSSTAAPADLNFDSNGTLWYLNSATGEFFGFDGTTISPVSVVAPALGRLSHAVVGPDNIRVATISQTETEATLSVLRLVKSEQTYSMKDPLQIVRLAGQVINLTWYSATEVVLLVNFQNQIDSVAVIVDIASGSQTIVRLPSGTTKIESNGFSSLVALDNQQRLWQRASAAWEQIGTGSDIATIRE